MIFKIFFFDKIEILNQVLIQKKMFPDVMVKYM